MGRPRINIRLPVVVVADTAGLRETNGSVEGIGVQRGVEAWYFFRPHARFNILIMSPVLKMRTLRFAYSPCLKSSYLYCPRRLHINWFSKFHLAFDP